MTDEQAHATRNVIDALDAQIAENEAKRDAAKRKGQDARANYWAMKVSEQQATRGKYAAQLEGQDDCNRDRLSRGCQSGYS